MTQTSRDLSDCLGGHYWIPVVATVVAAAEVVVAVVVVLVAPVAS